MKTQSITLAQTPEPTTTIACQPPSIRVDGDCLTECQPPATLTPTGCEVKQLALTRVRSTAPATPVIVTTPAPQTVATTLADPVPPTALAFTGAHTEVLGSIGLTLVAVGVGVRHLARRFA